MHVYMSPIHEGLALLGEIPHPIINPYYKIVFVYMRGGPGNLATIRMRKESISVKSRRPALHEGLEFFHVNEGENQP
jgi:hypothetical protein